MNTGTVRYGLLTIVLGAMTTGLLLIAAGSCRQARMYRTAFSPSGRLAVVEVRAEGPRGQMPEVDVRADGPEYRLETVEVVAAAAGPARGLLPVVEVQARRSVAGPGEVARTDATHLNVN